MLVMCMFQTTAAPCPSNDCSRASVTILATLIDHLSQLELLGELSAQSIEIADRVPTSLEKRFLG